jgi:hypothetical protein
MVPWKLLESFFKSKTAREILYQGFLTYEGPMWLALWYVHPPPRMSFGSPKYLLAFTFFEKSGQNLEKFYDKKVWNILCNRLYMS